jgi:hypothetical protein
LGFFAVFFVVTFSTPAIVASSSKNASTLSERLSLSASYSFTMALNLSAKSFVDVCIFHLFALVLYSAKHSPSIHRYYFFPFFYSVFSSGGVSASICASGWPTLGSACGLVTSTSVVVASLVGCSVACAGC